MMTSEKELESLLSACRKLMRSITTISRHGDDPGSWPVRIRTAKRHVLDAVLCLNLDSNTKEGSAGSLDRIAASLTTRLVSGLMAEVDREGSAEIDERFQGESDREGFHGYTWAIALPDLLGFLQMQQKSGILRVNIGTEVVSLIFDRGDLIHTNSDNSPPGSRLGEILVNQGAIDMENLERFLLRYSSTPGRLGDVLEAEGLITKACLRQALDQQVEAIFERLFSNGSAYYSFREGHSEEDIGVRRNVLQLLLEACRVRDEADRGDMGQAA